MMMMMMVVMIVTDDDDGDDHDYNDDDADVYTLVVGRGGLLDALRCSFFSQVFAFASGIWSIVSEFIFCF